MGDTVSSGDMEMTRKPNRRAFLKGSSAVIAASALAGVNVPHVFAAQDSTIRLALIGCGGRGGGAVVNALSAAGISATTAPTTAASTAPATPVSRPPVKLVAIADVFEE